MRKGRKIIKGWGNYPAVKAEITAPATLSELQQAVQQYPQLIARGGGNSYGDSSLQNVVISTQHLKNIMAEGADWIEVQAGITIAELLNHLVLQQKFLPITPGTKAVTVGGAIAADVHGKNQHQAGSFFNVTRSLQIVVADGKLVACNRQQNQALFYGCFGSMGLQGIIASAVIMVVPLPSEWMKERQYLTSSLPEMLLLMQQHQQAPYLVGWLDLLGNNIQGIVKTGEWVTTDESTLKSSSSGFTIPFRFPIAPPRFLFKWYNRLYLKKAIRQPEHILYYDTFFHPLDSIKNWRYAFGPKGLLQYHFILPLPVAEQGIISVIDKVRSSNAVCTLAVLKLFGKGNEETPYAFATAGFSLALDFIRSAAAEALIYQLDEEIKTFGGRIYKAKDAISRLPLALAASKFQSIQNQRYEHR